MFSIDRLNNSISQCKFVGRGSSNIKYPSVIASIYPLSKFHLDKHQRIFTVVFSKRCEVKGRCQLNLCLCYLSDKGQIEKKDRLLSETGNDEKGGYNISPLQGNCPRPLQSIQ